MTRVGSQEKPEGLHGESEEFLRDMARELRAEMQVPADLWPVIAADPEIELWTEYALCADAMEPSDFRTPDYLTRSDACEQVLCQKIREKFPEVDRPFDVVHWLKADQEADLGFADDVDAALDAAQAWRISKAEESRRDPVPVPWNVAAPHVTLARCEGRLRTLRRARRQSSQVTRTRPQVAQRPRERREAPKQTPTRAGPDDDPAEPEPPSDGRLVCHRPGCGQEIPTEYNGRKVRSDRVFCSTRCKAAVEDERRRPNTSAADRLHADPYLQRPLGEAVWLAPGEACRCNGHHIYEPDDGTCHKCGHTYMGRPSWRSPAPFYLALRPEAPRTRSELMAAALLAEIARDHRPIPRHGYAPPWRGERGEIVRVAA